MNLQQLRDQARLTCQFYAETKGGNLLFCNNPSNTDKCEGNCHPDTCPILELMTDEAIEDLFGDGSQFETQVQEEVIKALDNSGKPYHIFKAKGNQ